MTRLTLNEIYESYVSSYGDDHVHRQAGTPFRGLPGHHYFVCNEQHVCRRVSNEHLAQISLRSRHAEAALIKMNDAYIVSIGNTGVATATIVVPAQAARQQGIEEYRWIAHTHPLEQESADQGVARGPTGADFEALEQLHHRGWGQNESVVIVCRGGRVIEVVPFRREPPALNQGREDLLRSFRLEP